MLKTTFAAAALLLCVAAWADDAPAKKVAAEKTAPAKCMVTGSRVPRKGADCETPPFTRVYSKEDMQRTGRFNNAAALKALDPAL